MAILPTAIKYEGDNQTFVWKHPSEDFCTGSQLIVHESQEAVFFMNGEALDSFGAGVYTLETENMPLIGRLFNLVTGRACPFHCEVYFINKTEQRGLKWGTDTRIEYVEPTFGFPLQIGACGEMNLRIADGRKLLMKFVGTESKFNHSDIINGMRAILLTRLKPYLVTFIREKQISIFQIDEKLELISSALEEKLRPDFLEYGFSLDRFFVTTIRKPEDDEDYQRFRHLHFSQYAEVAEAKLRQQVGVIDEETAARRRVIEAHGLAEKRKVEGYTYQTERQFNIAEKMAGNEGVGQFTNMGVGMGMIAGLGNTLSNSVGKIVGDTLAQPAMVAPASAAPATAAPQGEVPPVSPAAPTAPPANVCPKCGASVNSGNKFCGECGALLPISCPNCGGAVSPSNKFCSECGYKLK